MKVNRGIYIHENVKTTWMSWLRGLCDDAGWMRTCWCQVRTSGLMTVLYQKANECRTIQGSSTTSLPSVSTTGLRRRSPSNLLASDHTSTGPTSQRPLHCHHASESQASNPESPGVWCNPALITSQHRSISAHQEAQNLPNSPLQQRQMYWLLHISV